MRPTSASAVLLQSGGQTVSIRARAQLILTGRLGPGRAPVEMARQRYDVSMPAQPGQPSGKARGLVGDLYYLVGAAVVEPAQHGPGRPARDVLIASAPGVVKEQHPPAWPDAAGDKRPEGTEAGRRHMGQPEAEEDHIVAAARLPGEEVGLRELHRLAAKAGTRYREHLR